MRKAVLLILVLVFTGTVVSADLTVEILDEENNLQNADQTLTQNGEVVDGQEDTTVINTTVNPGESYNITQSVAGLDLEIRNFSINEDFDFRPRVFEKETPKGEQFLTNLDTFYFVNQSFSFESALIDTGKNEAPDSIAKCTDFDNSLECNNWQINSTDDFSDNSPLDSETYQYEVTEFSAYSSGDEAPLPEINSIEIFDVTGEDERTGGTLVDEGLNKTFEVFQEDSTLYRFEFDVSNEGSKEWALTSDDVLEHSGLNSSWTVEDIYYVLDGNDNDGGEFSNGVVEWNTGNGGTLDLGESLSAEYVVNISQSSTSNYSQEFNAETTEETFDKDQHELKVNILGDLLATLDRPENESIVQNNREFVLNGSIDCENGDCGEITSTPRRNSTEGQISFTDEFFEVTDSSNADCGELLEDESCDIEWLVNATGEENTFHELDFEASSSFEEVGSAETENSIVEIQDILLIDLDWNTVDFGLLDPGDTDRPAEGNAGGYNLTVEEESNSIDNLWLKGSNLIHEEDESYEIGIGNMSYNDTVNDPENATDITENYSLVDTDLAPGAMKTFYYWLDVPLGILRGGYTGTITFKANQTIQ